MLKRYCFVLIAALTIGCASLPLKQRAVVSLQASETALEAAHDAERLLCSPTADQTKAITRCDGARAAAIGLTDAKHQALARAFSIAFDMEIRAANALIAWHAGEPPPSSLADYQTTLKEILAVIGTTIPSTETTVEKIQQAIDEAVKIAALLGGK